MLTKVGPNASDNGSTQTGFGSLLPNADGSVPHLVYKTPLTERIHAYGTHFSLIYSCIIHLGLLQLLTYNRCLRELPTQSSAEVKGRVELYFYSSLCAFVGGYRVNLNVRELPTKTLYAFWISPRLLYFPYQLKALSRHPNGQDAPHLLRDPNCHLAFAGRWSGQGEPISPHFRNTKFNINLPCLSVPRFCWWISGHSHLSFLASYMSCPSVPFT